MLTYFGGTDNKVYTAPGQIGVVTNEGTAAVNEAITFLNSTTAVPAMMGVYKIETKSTLKVVRVWDNISS